MEAAFQSHPVPQNVTNFEFHLIGDMTLKQFGYLASGLGFAYMVFVLFAAAAPFVAWPIIVISAGVGAAFAFLPIQERPLDHWMGAFFKAVFKPTKMSFKSNIITKEDPLFKNRLSIYLKTLKKQGFEGIDFENSIKSSPISPILTDKIAAAQAPNAAPALPATSAAPTTQPVPMQNTSQSMPHVNAPMPVINLSSPDSLLTPTAQVLSQPPPVPLSEGETLSKTVELAKESQNTQARIKQIEVQIDQLKTKAATPGEDPKEYLDKFQSLLTELQQLNNTAGTLATQMAAISQTSATHSNAFHPAKAKSMPTLTLTTFPNVINGIVTDNSGNYIENAIIVAHDRQGLPVRALKSNKLGQFIAATPLPNGVYTITVEKEGHMFDVVEVEIKDEISKPIVIAAKKYVVVS